MHWELPKSLATGETLIPVIQQIEFDCCDTEIVSNGVQVCSLTQLQLASTFSCLSLFQQGKNSIVPFLSTRWTALDADILDGDDQVDWNDLSPLQVTKFARSCFPTSHTLHQTCAVLRTYCLVAHWMDANEHIDLST